MPRRAVGVQPSTGNRSSNSTSSTATDISATLSLDQDGIAGAPLETLIETLMFMHLDEHSTDQFLSDVDRREKATTSIVAGYRASQRLKEIFPTISYSAPKLSFAALPEWPDWTMKHFDREDPTKVPYEEFEARRFLPHSVQQPYMSGLSPADKMAAQAADGDQDDWLEAKKAILMITRFIDIFAALRSRFARLGIRLNSGRQYSNFYTNSDLILIIKDRIHKKACSFLKNRAAFNKRAAARGSVVMGLYEPALDGFAGKGSHNFLSNKMTTIPAVKPGGVPKNVNGRDLFVVKVQRDGEGLSVMVYDQLRSFQACFLKETKWDLEEIKAYRLVDDIVALWETMSRTWQAAGAVLLLSTWSLSPHGSLTSLTLLLAATLLYCRFVSSRRLTPMTSWILTTFDDFQIVRSSRPASAATTLFGALIVGTTLSFTPSNLGLFTIVPNLEAVLGLISIATLFTLIPLLGFIFGEVVLQSLGPTSAGPWRATLIPASTFVMAGLVEETFFGVGRSFWWVKSRTGEDWLVAIGGHPLIDFACAGLAAALAEAGLRVVGMAEIKSFGTVVRQVSLLDDVEAPGDESDPLVASDRQPPSKSPVHAWLAYLPLLAFLLLPIVGPLVPTYSFHPRHPSPSDPHYRYPPLKVACVVPTTVAERHRSQKPSPGSSIEEWLHETDVIASRGAKILSWGEGAVRLEREHGGKPGGEGWEAMGKSEQDFLSKVAHVADQRRVLVYIAATYLLPAAHPHHKIYNLVTLVGPSLPSSTTPNIIFSTNKQLPVPIIETYSHISRSPRANFPVANLAIAHHPGTPSPNLTPLQEISVSSAICLDISSSLPLAPPNLSPALLLNPSSTPLLGLATSQFELARLRAIEHRSYVLRCDSASGLSGLIAPDGSLRAASLGEEGWESWEASVDAERAERRTFVEWMKARVGGGNGWWAALPWMLLLFLSSMSGFERSQGLLNCGESTYDRIRGNIGGFIGSSRQWGGRVRRHFVGAGQEGTLVDVS
ncbi:hypothetical protein P7C70_g44, partial [Phenoliferia sp. Uapishka_3]